MNNQLQIPWAQPCPEIIPSTRARFIDLLKRIFLKDHFQSGRFEASSDRTRLEEFNINGSFQQSIARSILR
jgi:hypothetical protein